MTTVIPDPNDKEYLRICDKLGFTLPEYKVETSGFEDDSKKNKPIFSSDYRGAVILIG